MIPNPLIRRFQYSQLRPRQAWVYMAIYLAVAAMLIILNVGYYQLNKGTPFSNYRTLPQLYKNLYAHFLGLQILILWFWTPYNTASAIGAEILRKSYDFFRMLPLSAQQKTWGIVIGRNLVPLLLAIINMVWVAGFGYKVGAPFTLQIQMFLALVSVAAPLNLIGILLSSRSAGAGQRSSLASVLISLILLIPYLMLMLDLMYAKDLGLYLELGRMNSHFFDAKTSPLLLISMVALYFWVWTYRGAIRQFNREEEPLISRSGACLFVTGMIVLAMGLCWPLSRGSDSAVKGLLWVVSFIPLLFVPFGAIKSYNHYQERLGLKGGSDDSSWRVMVSISNLTLGLALFGIWTGFAIVHGFLAGYNPSLTAHFILTHFSVYALLFLLLECYVVYQPVNSKIGVFVGFIILMDFILPLILGAIFESDTLFRLSLFRIWGDIFDHEMILKAHHYRVVLAVNLLFCFPLVWLVVRRYRLAIRAWNGEFTDHQRSSPQPADANESGI
ncbi:MAG: hypothetical protein HYV35_06235 [Lentisphaerae bacterium]|nr:hypothetical protein [Lentisphaerota bacterium]